MIFDEIKTGAWRRLRSLSVFSLLVSLSLIIVVINVYKLFTVRRSALHGLWDRNSVRLSV